MAFKNNQACTSCGRSTANAGKLCDGCSEAQRGDASLSLAPPLCSGFQGLEEAYNEPAEAIVLEPLNSPWVENDGSVPDLPFNSKIDVQYDDNSTYTGFACHFDESEWSRTYDGKRDIVKWRFHKPEDAEYYVQPKTKEQYNRPTEALAYTSKCVTDSLKKALQPESVVQSSVEAGVDVTEVASAMASGFTLSWPAPEAGEEIVGYTFSNDGAYDCISEPAIDAHYDFTYVLTDGDIANGSLKLDPYFVAKNWELGQKDDSGVLFHIFKTICRFGEKNSREREMNAIYKSIKRLAELEGVDLK